MSGYSDGEALLLAALQQHANYNDDNSSRGNWKLLNSGEAARYAVLRMGTFTVSVQSLGGLGANATATEHVLYNTEIILYRRYKDDGTSATDLQADVEMVRAHMMTWRNIGDSSDTVIKSRITKGGPMQETRMGEKGHLRRITKLRNRLRRIAKRRNIPNLGRGWWKNMNG
jgi:hypothetical protein